ncbi:DUF881 domain-containing protein [Anoxynatronum sibiricum]|uniref:DUF881 domain-containing protein n=1 Tax=Anoxynatronum sibiricum TaxID=210623 RepID=A0ABU9VUH2_9CLOT
MSFKSKIVITFFFLVYGVLIGINLGPEQVSEPPGGFFSIPSETNVQEVEDLMKANEDMRQRIQNLKLEVDALEGERAEGNVTLQVLMQEVQHYQMLAGHKAVVGPGITVLLEGIFEENIAPLVYQRKYLVTLVNELRSNGAEVIAVNGNRMTGRSEMALAGNHIQVNGRPVAPPYLVQAIGDQSEFKRYVAHRTFIFDLMAGDGITATIEYNESLNIDKPHREKAIQFLEVRRP